MLALSGNESIREIAYNVADVINKVGFGVACVIAAKTLSSLESEGKLRQPDPCLLTETTRKHPTSVGCFSFSP